MAVVTINSKNPMFSHAISKNPASGVVARSVRSGVGYGWYSVDNDVLGVDTQQYNLFFEETAEALSFSDQNFAYNDHSSVTSPSAYLGLFDALLRSNTKGVTEHDTEALHSIVFHNLHTFNVKAIEHLSKHLPGDFTAEELNDKTFKLTFEYVGTFNETINIASIVMMFLSNRQAKAKFTTDYFVKYAKLIAKINAPYYVRYMFLRNFASCVDQFKNLARWLETETISFAYGDTRWHRFTSILSDVANSPYPILDVGCGEGYYSTKAEQMTALGYVGVDRDPEMLDKAEGRSKARELDNKFYPSIDLVPDLGCRNILLTEVIEHSPEEESIKLVKGLLERKFNKLIITVPNRDFNVNYGLTEGEFRHDDHDWEPNQEEFHAFVEYCVNGKFDIEFGNIGDCVNGQYESFKAVVKNDNIKPTAIICVGAPGCGKSTWAERILNRYNLEGKPERFMELNRDNIRFRGKPKDWSKYTFNGYNEGKVTKKFEQRMHNAIEQGLDIICSDTNINIVHRTRLIQTLQDAGYDVSIKHFLVDLDDLYFRNHNREGGIPRERVLHYYIEMERQFNGASIVTDYDGNETMYILDVDGTMLNIDHRNPHDSTEMINDKANHHISNIAKLIIECGIPYVIFSGRNESDRDVTLEVLYREVSRDIDTRNLFMRADGDFRQDHVVKREMFETNLGTGIFNYVAVDDRKQVIEQCWSVLGVKTIDVGKTTERF